MRGKKMRRALVVLAAFAAVLFAGREASAQGYAGDIMSGGPAFFGGGFGGGPRYYGGGGAGPIPRETVYLPTNYAPGTIVINTTERRLYLVEPGGQALRYGIGVGRDGFRWSGVHRVSAKREWPGWTPPRQMLARRPDLPRSEE